jgi:hypothetical protein
MFSAIACFSEDSGLVKTFADFVKGIVGDWVYNPKSKNLFRAAIEEYDLRIKELEQLHVKLSNCMNDERFCDLSQETVEHGIATINEALVGHQSFRDELEVYAGTERSFDEVSSFVKKANTVTGQQAVVYNEVMGRYKFLLVTDKPQSHDILQSAEDTVSNMGTIE